MSMAQDLEALLETLLASDPSLQAVDEVALQEHIDNARRSAHAGSKDAFLLALMRLLALGENGHTRLIPNNAISVVPLRFVAIGDAVLLRDAPGRFKPLIGAKLITVNGVPIDRIEAAAAPYLAGTRQRKRVVGAILFAWPGTLAHFGVVPLGDTITYRLRDDTGRETEITMDAADCVAGADLYPQNEHGRADAQWSPNAFLEVQDFGPRGLLLRLPSFFDPGPTRLSKAVGAAADLVASRPTTPLLLDVRGNTGGNFLRTLPLIDAVAEEQSGRRVGVLVDKFTFSAAIVFVAILKHRLGARLSLIGEEMGDGLTFFAEGGTLDLPSCGAVVRYSTAFHDWAGGRIDATTPPEIAKEIVAVGALHMDQHWTAAPDDEEALHRFCEGIFDGMNGSA